MTVKFKRLPTGMCFLLVLGTVEYVGRKIVPFKAVSINEGQQHINAFLIPKEKHIHGSGGIIASIPRKLRVRLAA